MALSGLSFSDLILLPDGRGLLKGVPGQDQQLVPVPETDLEELNGLPKALLDSFRLRSELECSQDGPGTRRHPDTIRFRHCGVSYRVAAYDNIDNGRTWFLRRLADKVPALDAIGLPPQIVQWLLAKEQSQGLVLFSGAQASGKTTSAAALIHSRLALHGGHGVTFENPVEMPLAGKHGENGHCFQTDMTSESELAAHIERAHRYASPNIVFIGEIRSKYAATEALRVSLGSSQQMVVATIHGLDVGAALERLLTWARELEGDAAWQNLASSLLAVIHQELATGDDGKRVLRCPEFLLVPFKQSSNGLRAKLRDGQLTYLRDEMREQRNRIQYKGINDI